MAVRGLNSEMKKWNAILAIYIKVIKNHGYKVLCTGFGSVSLGLGWLLRSKMIQPL